MRTSFEPLRITLALAGMCGLLLGCSGGPPSQLQPGTADLVAHEWGTFTSVYGSDGRQVAGLLREDEPPPPFVHRRTLLSPLSKKDFGERLAHPVTQRMETPVIYFYSPKKLDVRVDVSFPSGIVTEWYPQAAAYLPGVATAEQTLAVESGEMTWKITLDPQLTGLPPAQDYIWVPAREVASTPLVDQNNASERDRFIFYRGVARFVTPLRTTSPALGQVALHHDGAETIPAAFAIWVRDGKGLIQPLGAIEPGVRPLSLPPKEMPLDDYVEEAATLVATALEATGLYADEALAMVNTWKRSYFRTSGVRILYVLPRVWTDALLPIRVEPTPKELVRTLVGRIEVLSPEEENLLVQEIQASAQSTATFDVTRLGTFAEPKLRRAMELLPSAELKAYCQGLIERAVDL